MTNVSRNSRPAHQPTAEIPLKAWKGLHGKALEKQLDATVKGANLTADDLRRLVINLSMLEVRPTEPAFVKWMDGRAPAALASASGEERGGLQRQLRASGFSEASVRSWSADPTWSLSPAAKVAAGVGGHAAGFATDRKPRAPVEMSGRAASQALIPQGDVHGAPKGTLTVHASQRAAGAGVDVNLQLDHGNGDGSKIKVSGVEFKVNGKAYAVPPDSISSDFGRFAVTLRYDGEGKNAVNNTLKGLVQNKPAEVKVTYEVNGKKHEVSSKLRMIPTSTGGSDTD